MTNSEQRVRMLAYRIWESEGRPEGQGHRHWEMAERIVEAENAREEEHEWGDIHDESSPLEGEDPPAEPDELGIDELRLPLDDPETEALKEEDTGVEVNRTTQTRQQAQQNPAEAGESPMQEKDSTTDAGSPAAKTAAGKRASSPRRASSKATGSKVDGSKADGSKAEGSKVDGSKAEGSKAKSANAEGAEKPAAKAKKPRVTRRKGE